MGDYTRRVMLQILGAAATACGTGSDTDTALPPEEEGGAAGEAGASGKGGAGRGGSGGSAQAGKGGGGAAGRGAGAGGKEAGGAGGKEAGGAGGKEAGAGGKEEGGAGGKGEAGKGGSAPATPPTTDEMLGEIDTFVVVMMENRAFDHIYGALKRDKTYPNASKINGTTGKETNPWKGHKDVGLSKATTWTLESPPHDFTSVHNSWDNGKNDGFVDAGAAIKKSTSTDTGKTHMDHPEQVMAYYDRTQLPFYYWLADNFTVCDNWHCSVMGPTWPNRAYSMAGSSDGEEGNNPQTNTSLSPIWNRMKAAKKTAIDYYSSSSNYAGSFDIYIKKTGVNPTKKIAQFFTDAAAGKLPNYSLVEPSYGTNSDHPPQDIRKGQTFVASIYSALAKSPQWKNCLLIITYDEHGGFYDHVAPPKAADDHAAFENYGMRVPAIFVGPTVREGHLTSTLHDHTSIIATLAKRFDMPLSGKREKASKDFSEIFDPALYQKPKAAPAIPKSGMPKLDADAINQEAFDNTPEMTALIAAGLIPEDMYDPRPEKEIFMELLAKAVDLGAVEIE